MNNTMYPVGVYFWAKDLRTALHIEPVITSTLGKVPYPIRFVHKVGQVLQGQV